MKRMLIVVLAALSLSACSTVTASLMQRGAKAPADDTVRAFIRLDDEAGAREWLLKMRMPDAYIDEAIVLAKEQVAKERARCAGRSTCAVAAPQPAPAITLLEVVPETDEQAAQPPKE